MPGHRSGQCRNDPVVSPDTDVYFDDSSSPDAGGNDVKMETKGAICGEVLPPKRPLFLHLTRFDPQSSEIKTQAVGH